MPNIFYNSALYFTEEKHTQNTSKSTYHHDADEGSTLGLSWINPDEIELFDSELKEIFDWIDENCVIKMVAA